MRGAAGGVRSGVWSLEPGGDSVNSSGNDASREHVG